jgi:hypothetical protein
MPNDLRSAPIIGGRRVSSCSPSTQSDEFTWPGGAIRTHPLNGNPTELIGPAGEKALIYRRGTSPWEEVQNKLLAVSQAIAEARAQGEREAQARIAELEAEVLGAAEAGPDEQPEPLEVATCQHPAPHFDCVICPDDTTRESPRHFAAPSREMGHRRGEEHKRLAAKAA